MSNKTMTCEELEIKLAEANECISSLERRIAQFAAQVAATKEANYLLMTARHSPVVWPTGPTNSDGPPSDPQSPPPTGEK